MPITELLERNAREFPKDIALVEINPEIQEKRRVTWRDYELIQPDARHHYRRDITWHVFNEKANRVANLLISRGIRKGDKVAILLMNCLEWLPIYFGILKTGALAVPMNFRFDAQEIKYCLELSETDVLIFGPEFVGRIEEIVDEIDEKRILFYVGGDCPTFAEDYDKLASNCSSLSPEIEIKDSDDAAIYFLQEQQVSQRLFYIITKVLCMRQKLNRIIMDRLRMMYFCAFHRFIIQVPRCIGLAVF